jgi:hypothetical protein
MTPKNRALSLGLALTMTSFGGIGLAAASDTAEADLESTRQRCSDGSLLGTYLFEYVARPAANAPYNASGGYRYFDGRGAGRMVSSDVMTSTLQTERFRYSVEPDCTGTIDYRSGTTSEEIFVHPQGLNFSWLDTRPGFVASGQDWRSAKRAPSQCSTATLKGTYNASGRGNADPPGLDELFAEAGMESFDGQGRVLSRYINSAGESGVFAGTYRVSANCVGQVRFETGETYRIFVGPTGDDFVSVDLFDDFGSLGSGHKISDRLLVTED